MRKLALLLVFVCFAGMAAGCALDKAADASLSDRTQAEYQSSMDSTGDISGGYGTETAGEETLRIGWWGSQTRHDATLAVLDLYAKKTGIQFEPEFYSFEDYIAKLNTLIAANDAPDIMQMGGNFPTYINYIEILNDYIDKGMIDTSGTDRSFLSITTLEGKVMGISLGTNAQAMAYDPAIFQKAGVAIPTNHWTWGDYENAALAIHRRLGILGSSKLDEFKCLTGFLQQYGTGESFFLAPYRLKLNYTDDSKVAEFFAMKNRLTSAGAYPTPAQMAEIKDIEGDPIVKGNAAMTWISSNQFVALSKAAQRSLAIVFPPRRTKDGPLSQSIMSSQMFCISRSSAHKDSAARFISFFVNDLDANAILNGERGVPINGKVREELSSGFDSPTKAVYDYLTQLGEEASLEIILDSPVQSEIRDIYTSLSEEVVFGQMTPEAAAAQLRKRAEKVLSGAN